MVAETLSEADLAASLPEVLERVRAGARFAVERDGEVIATISPPAAEPGVTLRALAAELALLPPLDDDFRSDVDVTRTWLGPTKTPR